jgi:hypothetical protein
MAVQFSVAYSSIVKGAGIVAGGPYYCAQGNVNTATTLCSCTGIPIFSPCRVGAGGTDVRKLIEVTDRSAAEGAIDPVSNLAHQRIWMFSGTRDTVVPQAVMNDLQTYYRHYIAGANIQYIKDMPAQHAMPTDSFGNACGIHGLPYINNCGFDAAGEMLKWIYGSNLNPKNSGTPTGNFIEFDQGEFLDDRLPAAHGMANRGFLYVPASCEKTKGRSCKLHVAFHGCEQDPTYVQDKFIRHAGYNQWADTNNIIILYPQTAPTAGSNPNGCWDWFDFNRNDPHYAQKNGRQMLALRRMIDRIAGVEMNAAGPVQCFIATNFAHVLAGRAHDRFFMARANGSNQNMGFDSVFTTTSLKRTGPGFYVIGTCP